MFGLQMHSSHKRERYENTEQWLYKLIWKTRWWHKKEMPGIIVVWNLITRESDIEEDLYIYTDSHGLFKRCTEWVPFWERNHCEVNWVSLWQWEIMQEILNTAKQKNLLLGRFLQTWNNPVYMLNNEEDALTWLTRVATGEENEKCEHLLEWLHVKKGHSGNQDLFKEAITRGWPVTRELCNTVISACSLCHAWLRYHHPLKNPPMHLTQNKSLVGRLHWFLSNC